MKRRHLLVLTWVYCAILPAWADAVLTDIEQQIDSRQYYQALSQLDKLPSKDRHNPRYQFYRAQALAGSGQHDKAISQYQSLIKSYPDLPEAYNNLAVIYFQQGKAEQARKVLEKAMQAHAGYAQVYKNLQALNAAQARDAYARALQMPAKRPPLKLLSAEKLVLQQAAIASVRPVPAAKSATSPSLRYQAKNSLADKKTAPETKTVVATGQDFEEASAVLQQWAEAWATKKVERYIGFYSQAYSPPGMSRGHWERQRHKRINKPKWIQVKLRDLRLHARQGDSLVIRLVQEYSADKYRDMTRKEFVMQKSSGKWQIIKERGLGYITP